jgi:magnesium-transporting ATPase (P-type)
MMGDKEFERFLDKVHTTVLWTARILSIIGFVASIFQGNIFKLIMYAVVVIGVFLIPSKI